jgi:hypothetical protein
LRLGTVSMYMAAKYHIIKSTKRIYMGTFPSSQECISLLQSRTYA